jgi:hypothetical protein
MAFCASGRKRGSKQVLRALPVARGSRRARCRARNLIRPALAGSTAHSSITLEGAKSRSTWSVCSARAPSSSATTVHLSKTSASRDSCRSAEQLGAQRTREPVVRSRHNEVRWCHTQRPLCWSLSPCFSSSPGSEDDSVSRSSVLPSSCRFCGDSRLQQSGRTTGTPTDSSIAGRAVVTTSTPSNGRSGTGQLCSSCSGCLRAFLERLRHDARAAASLGVLGSVSSPGTRCDCLKAREASLRPDAARTKIGTKYAARVAHSLRCVDSRLRCRAEARILARTPAQPARSGSSQERGGTD